MRLSIAEHDKLSKLYEEKVLVEMDVGGIMGGSPTSGGAIENIDSYAAGDTRIPKVLGGVQTRKGLAKKKGKKKRNLARFVQPNRL